MNVKVCISQSPSVGNIGIIQFCFYVCFCFCMFLFQTNLDFKSESVATRPVHKFPFCPNRMYALVLVVAYSLIIHSLFSKNVFVVRKCSAWVFGMDYQAIGINQDQGTHLIYTKVELVNRPSGHGQLQAWTTQRFQIYQKGEI